MSSAGTLYVVATPIGNLADITVRALEVLRTADIIACEDTRTSRILLDRWGISARRISIHKFSESRQAETVMEFLSEGKNIAFISDAGTPAISDPGARIVAKAHSRGFKVCPIPGPSAVMAALSVSGIETSSFFWAGFVPKSEQGRRKLLKDIHDRQEACVVFETPRRIRDTLAAAAEVLGPRAMVMCRELTKLYEEVLLGTAEEILKQLATKPVVKGEIVLVVEPKTDRTELISADEAVRLLTEEGLSGRDLVLEAKKRFGIGRTAAYESYLRLKEGCGSGEKRKRGEEKND